MEREEERGEDCHVHVLADPVLSWDVLVVTSNNFALCRYRLEMLHDGVLCYGVVLGVGLRDESAMSW